MTSQSTQQQPAPPTPTVPYLKNYTLRDYQEQCYAAIGQAIRNYKGPFYVDMTVGAGKTALSAAIIARMRELGRSVMVLARQGELVEQNADCYWECGVRNSIYSASLSRKSTHFPVVVGTEGTVARAIDGDLREYSCDMLIIDENHMVDYANPDSQYMKIINELLRRNPKMIIFGMTGSPFRGDESILGPFWKSCVYKIGTETLVDRGFLVPTFFGSDVQKTDGYDLHEWAIPEGDHHTDYSSKELQAMQRKITKDKDVTAHIIDEVVEITKNRNAVMITGAGLRHLEQIAECLPEDSYFIITDKTSTKERRQGLKDISQGKKKFLLQVNVLSTGYSEPLLDTTVIMRKIGSLTLLTQLLGRGMRLLKPHHVEAGYVKDDHVVLDYSETLSEMADLYANPILEQAQLEKAKKDHDLILCPSCNTQNSKFARRCIGQDPFNTLDGRCEWFWVANKCPGCETQNDPSAEECRRCGQMLKDPNKNLANKHYTDDDWRQVYKMTMKPTSNAEGVVVEYLLHVEGEPLEGARTRRVDGTLYEVATEIFWPLSDKQWARGAWKTNFLSKHLHRSGWGHVKGKNSGQICRMSALFDVPTHVTHRRNADNYSIIHRKRFLSGRVEDNGQKR